MKFFFASFLIGAAVLSSFHASAQSQRLRIGVKANVGAAKLTSSNFQKMLDARAADQKNVTLWKVDKQPGLYAGAGIYAEYNIDLGLSLIAEMTYNQMTSTYKTDYEERNPTDGDREVIHSEAKFDISYLSVPILLSYNFSSTDAGVYLLAGAGFNFLAGSTIASHEVRTKETYKNTILETSSSKTNDVSADINTFPSPRTDLIVGLGSSGLLKSGRLRADLRLNLGLTKSEMYTTDANFHATAYRTNDLFSIYGKQDAEKESPSVHLDDYAISSVAVSLGFSLFGK